MPEFLLERLPIFGGIERDRLRQVETLAQWLDCSANEIVYRTGESCDGLYVVVRGSVLFRTERIGQPVERLKELGTNEVFGEREALDGIPREFTVRSLGESSLLHLPMTVLDGLLAEHPLLETALRTLTIRRRSAFLRASLGSAARREPRIWVDREVQLTLDGGEKLKVRLEDLSPGGACFSRAPLLWGVGTRLRFSLGLEGRPDLLLVSAEVRWRERSSLGLAFKTNGPAHRRSVEHALDALARPAAPGQPARPAPGATWAR
jgi:CRP-like cAMP-binding protein